ncbi:hypothetical protein QBC32DRAFT_66402 [Pseudoneurospora amorphoporcata]|uniref:Uncharacterized protein n=1 Tax=Pseudoneurospora amorphoporcata TaxID=241081 RepID=A0AAN6NLL4_9PEZI|nr:hypothetical protein QBC32DRAFT_66402 [Pseudoneurospora amorphoporcata]
MPSSDNTNTFPILRLPLEIRFMIYRELWTHLADPDNEDLDDDDSNSEGEDNNEEDPNSHSHHNDDSDWEDLEQVTQHLEMVTTIKNLRNSCHQVRDELIAEFFTRVLSKTQIHVGDVYPPEPRYDSSGRRPTPRGKILQLPLINPKIFKVLQSSSLVTQYIQHVSVRWDGCSCAEAKRMNRDMRHFGVWYTDAVRATGLDWLAECESLKTL